MSLAATLAADGMRPASFVPVVKCSQCAQEIEIASMGAHVCTKTLTAAAYDYNTSTYPDDPPRSPAQQHYSICDPYTVRHLSATGHQPAHAPSPLQYSQQPDEPVPPMPDWMQNRPYGEDHPASQTSSSMPTIPRIDTFASEHSAQGPRSPIVDRSAGSGGRRPLLSSKTPPQLPRVFDDRPPSECMSPNLDCAFPPFPINNAPIAKRKPSQARKAPASLSTLPPRGSSKHGRSARLAPDSSLEPKSPLPYAGENVLQRMDSLQSGPFDGGKSTPSSNETSRSTSALDQRRPSEMNAFDLQGLNDEHELESLSTTHDFDRADSPPALEASPMIDEEIKTRPPARPARPTSSDVLSPAFLRQLADDAPLRTQPQDVQSPPLPPKSPERARFPRMFGSLHREQSEPMSEDAPTQHSPRKESLAQQGSSVPARMLRQDSAHTPSQSGSSTTSSNHSAMNSNSTNATSPVGSATSSLDIFSPTPYSGPTFGEDGKGSGYRMPEEPGMRAEMPARRSPPRNFARLAPTVPPKDFELPKPTVPRIVEPQESPMDPALHTFSQIQHSDHQPTMRPPVIRTRTEPTTEHTQPTSSRMSYEPPLRLTIQTETPSLSREPTLPFLYEDPTPRSPIEPSIQAPPPPPEPVDTPALFPTRQSSLRDPRRNRSKSNAGQTPRHVPRPSLPQANRMVHPPPRSDSHGLGGAVQPPARRPNTAGKSHCRGCNELIEGKSVKASDGRLTGRWHRACFTCKTCRQPFETADFYVYDDQPYCEHHYHEKNGSLCQGCNHGIEGQYLEASTMTRQGRIDKKYHPRCFTCTECREVLSDDYYEFRGRVFCERHALAAMRSQARPGLGVPDQRGMRAERRTTRLMMMGPGSIPGLS